jgi:F0F1-type ATP synthase assembly protein I
VLAGSFGLEFSNMPEKPNHEPDTSPVPSPKKKDTIVSLARYSELGFMIPAAILLGYFLGRLADYWLHTRWLYLVGLLFGAVVGFWQMIRMAVGAFKDKDDDG